MQEDTDNEARPPKTLAEIDEALSELSRQSGGSGEVYRTAHGGRHRFEADRGEARMREPADAWGQSLADAAGCRLKIFGASDDLLFVIGFLDADNWSLDERGAPRPYGDGSFEEAPGTLFEPGGDGPVARAPSLGGEPEERPSAERPAGPASDDGAGAAGEGAAQDGPAARARRRLGALAVLEGLVACGVGADEIEEALEELRRRAAW